MRLVPLMPPRSVNEYLVSVSVNLEWTAENVTLVSDSTKTSVTQDVLVSNIVPTVMWDVNYAFTKTSLI